MDAALFKNYQDALAKGDRREAGTHMKAFIQSFTSMEEKEAWTEWFFRHEYQGHKIRNSIQHKLYEHVIFPVLLAGYRKSDPRSLRWLERTAHDLYKTPQLWAQVDHTTKVGFARQLLAVCPDDAEAKQSFLNSNIDWLEYCIHEWPAGILYGNWSATLEQCQEILETLKDTAARDESEKTHGITGRRESQSSGVR